MKRDPLYPFVEPRPGVLRRFVEALVREIEIMASHRGRKLESRRSGRHTGQNTSPLQFTGQRANQTETENNVSRTGVESASA